jgi:hypothetical protein
MNSNRIVGLLTRAFLVVSLLFGVLVFTGTTADAQRRFRGGGVVVRPRVFVYPRTFYPRSFYWGFGPNYYYNPYYSNRVTEGQGYKDGIDDGKDDAKHNKGYDPYRHGDYKNGQTSGYIDGYLRGYADGFRRYNG